MAGFDWTGMLSDSATAEDDELKRRLRGQEFTNVSGAPIAAPNQMQGDDSGDVTGSHFINFNRLFNANAGKAQTMAQGLVDNAQKASSKAKTGAANARTVFDNTPTGVHPYGQVDATGWQSPGAQTTTPTSTTGGTTANNTGGNTGTSQQALQGTPQRGGATPEQPTAPAGSITPKEAQARASAATGGSTSAKDAAMEGGSTQPQAYTGPDGLADFGNLLQQGVDADQRAAALGSAGGRQALLADAYGQDANSGGSRLDAALAGTAGGDRWQGLSNYLGGNADYVQGLENQAEGKAQNQKDIAAATNARTAQDKAAYKDAMAHPQTRAGNGDEIARRPKRDGKSFEKDDEGTDFEKYTIGGSLFSGTTGDLGMGGTMLDPGTLATERQHAEQVWATMSDDDIANFKKLDDIGKYKFIQKRARLLGLPAKGVWGDDASADAQTLENHKKALSTAVAIAGAAV